MPSNIDTPLLKSLLAALEGAENCRSIDPLGRVCWHCWDRVIEAKVAIDPKPIDVMFSWQVEGNPLAAVSFVPDRSAGLP